VGDAAVFHDHGIPLRRGRDIEDADTSDRSWVAVGQFLIRRAVLAGSGSHRKDLPAPRSNRTVIGVVGDVRVRGLERTSEPQIYVPAPQVAERSASNLDPKDLVVRHAGPVDALVPAIRQIVREVDPEQPISDVRPMDDVLAGDTATRHAQLQVLGVLAAVAVLLAGVGIYGLLAYTVSQRSQEIGVRLALGAEPSRVGRMIFADGMRLAAFGIVPGVLGAYAAGRGMSALLFGVAPSDPATFAAGVAVAFLMTLAGSLVPAIRAVRVSPMSVLRSE
jgi:ABC-type antimicrobial peptide transport system permease subunit